MQTAKEKGYSQSAALPAHEDAAKGGSIFKLHSEYKTTGDQPQAIEALVNLGGPTVRGVQGVFL